MGDHAMIVAMAKAMAKAEGDEGWSNTYVSSARAALTALLEPTPDMVEIGGVEAAMFSHRDCEAQMTGKEPMTADQQIREIFSAMIQQALTASQTTTATKGER